MDIEFFCSHCGQSLSIDERGAGITVDCPKCKKAAYVPSKAVAAPETPPGSLTQVPQKKTLGQPPRPPTIPKPPPAQQTLPGHNLALTAGETVVLQGRMHVVVVALPGILFVSSCVIVGIIGAMFQYLMQFLMGAIIKGSHTSPMFAGIFLLPCILFLFLAVIGTFFAWLARSHTLITLTNRRLIINEGVLSKAAAELLLPQIESVAIRLPLLGRIFGYGTVVVRGTGGGVFNLQFMENAEQLYSKLQSVSQVSK